MKKPERIINSGRYSIHATQGKVFEEQL